MAFILDDYINKYVQDAGDADKKVARHLKEIIPRTTHLDENGFNEIIEELKQEMDRGKDFKDTFFRVSDKYILKGDFIEAELPDILTRIIPNREKYIMNLIINIENRHRKPYVRRELKIAFASGNKNRIIRLLRKLRKTSLSRNKVVFATFDEKNKDRDPFLDCKVIEIIDRLALDKDVFDQDEPYTAVKVRYSKGEDFDKRYPIFIDAGWWDKFFPAEIDDNYGRTRSLDPSLPGMPEVVHENMKLSDVIIEEFEFLEDK
jgi:hypothetical protein